MRRQIKFTYQIGYPSQNPQFEGSVIRAASKLCGGCTTDTRAGWWMSDGDSHAETFEGTLEREHCFTLELTCEERKAERVYAAMAEQISQAAIDWGVDTDWVHVSETVMTGRHFSVKATNRALAQAMA